MKKTSVSDSKLSPKLDAAIPADLKAIGPVDAAALAVGSLSVYVGWEAFRRAFSTPDRTLCCTLVAIGFVVVLLRSDWRGHLTRLRFGIAIAGIAIASLMICLDVALANPQWSQLAWAATVIGWGAFRIRGEAISQSLTLGAALTIPLAIDLLEYRSFFEWLESTTVSATSLFADAQGLPHVVTDGTILFKQGVADHFASIGESDSVVSLLGVSFLCILTFRRGLLVSAATVITSVCVWVSVRGAIWVMLASLADRNLTWTPWTDVIGWCGLFVGALLVVSLGQFFAIVFKPVPFELFNPESPLVAFTWNWICGLPRIVLRIPQDHKIALRWRTWVKLAGKKPSFQTDFDWMKREFFELLYHPLRAIGSAIDLARGWRGSRQWRGFFLNSISLILLMAFYIALGLSMFNRNDSQAKSLIDESLQLCSTRTLELACERLLEPEFSQAIGAVARVEFDAPLEMFSDTLKRYLELQCRRVLEIEPNHRITKYRLGLIATLNKRYEQAELEMKDLTGNQFREFWQANAWLAKSLVIKKSSGDEIAKYDLMDHLDKASKWKEADFRLLLLYARLLEEQGDNKKSVDIVKQVVIVKPELILELAKLCARIGDDEGRIAAANQAEGYFAAKINFLTEKELDRQSLADAMLLNNRLESAADVLQEGLRLKLGGSSTVRQLSDVQRLIYLKTIIKNSDGKFESNLDLLEAMADTDPTNPNLSGEIAKLLVFKVKPTEKLLEVLKDQITRDIIGVPSLLMLGEGHFVNSNFKEAQKYWELALVKEPDNYAALNNLASCLIALSSSHVDRALELVAKASAIAPTDPNVLDTWGEVLVLANRPKEAINKFELAIRLDRGRIETRQKLVAAYKALGMIADAEQQSKVIAEMEQSNARTPLEAK